MSDGMSDAYDMELAAEYARVAEGVVYDLPKASLEEHMQEAMRRNRGSQNPRRVQQALEVARIEIGAAREYVAGLKSESPSQVGSDPWAHAAAELLKSSRKYVTEDLNKQIAILLRERP